MENNNIIKVLVAVIVIFLISTVVLVVKLYSPSITGSVIKGTQGSAGDDSSASGSILKNIPFKDKDGNSIAESLTSKTSITTVSSKNTINHLLELKTVSKNKQTVRIAELVTLINRYIDENADNNLLSSWQKNIVGCVYAGNCPDNAYLQVIDDVVASDLSQKSNMLTHSIIETANLWNSQNLVIFSDSLAKTNKMVKEYGTDKVKEQWDGLVACNGQCADFQDKVFAAVSTINNQ